MKLDVGSNAEEYAESLARFIRESALAIPKALRYQGRLLAQELVRRTPPATRAQGRRSVERDIKRAERPLRPQDFESAAIRALIRKRDYAALETVFSRFPEGAKLRNVSVVTADPKWHAEARDRRGRVSEFQRRATPDEDTVRDYIRQMQTHVGQAKGGWAASLLALGGRPAAWIAAHANAGSFEDHADNRVLQYIQLTNASAWAGSGDEDRVVAITLRSRALAILNDLARALKRKEE